MSLESVVLSEISETQKDRCLMTPLTCGAWRGVMMVDISRQTGIRNLL